MNKQRLKNLLTEYGGIALWTYFGLFVVVLSAFAVAISLGFEVDSAPGGAGVIGAAYIATKLTQPLRIAGALVLTPLVARVVRSVRGGPVQGQVVKSENSSPQQALHEPASSTTSVGSADSAP